MKGKVVVVTGASAGVGRATAVEFARRGAKLGLIARGEKRLQQAVEECRQVGGEAIAIPTDVADAAAVDAAAARVEEELGSIDIWVNDAMTTIFAPVNEIEPDEYRRATEVTYLGTVYGSMAALKRMRTRDRGTIVQVGSALAYRAIPLQSAYCGAKHGIRAFSDSLRCELIHDNSQIKVTMVQMPALNTPQFNWCRNRLPNHPQPVPPIFQPEVAARAIVHAAEHYRREYMVGRSAVWTILGNKFFPGFGDRYLAANGYDGQQTDDPVDPDRPNNLFESVDADYGAHGIFDDQASDSSWQWWATTHRGIFWALVVIVVVLVILGIVGLEEWLD